MTSGSCLSAWRSPCSKVGVSRPTSSCEIIAFWLVWMYSIGSSIVMILHRKALLIRSIIAASVVVLPLPVVPVTSVSPRSDSAMSCSTGGSWSSSIVRTFSRITRITIAGVPRWLYTLQRNRQRPGISYEKSSPWYIISASVSAVTSGLIEAINAPSSSAEIAGDSTARISPPIRSSGEAPVWKWMSEAPCSTANLMNGSNFMRMPRESEEDGSTGRRDVQPAYTHRDRLSPAPNNGAHPDGSQPRTSARLLPGARPIRGQALATTLREPGRSVTIDARRFPGFAGRWRCALAEPRRIELESLTPRLERAFAFAAGQVRTTIERHPDYFPIYTDGGRWEHRGELWTDWCGGFHAGMMWLIAGRTGDPWWRAGGRALFAAARAPTARPRRPRPRLHLPEHVPALAPADRRRAPSPGADHGRAARWRCGSTPGADTSGRSWRRRACSSTS